MYELGSLEKLHSMIVEYSSTLVCVCVYIYIYIYIYIYACACTCVYKELIRKESVADCNLSCFVVFS